MPSPAARRFGRRTACAAGLLGALAASALQAQQASRGARDSAAARDRAGAALLAGQYEEAAREAASCLAAEGSTAGTGADCALELGRARFQLGDLAGAASALQPWRGKFGELEAQGEKLLGESLLLSGRAAEAAGPLRAAMAQDAGGPDALEAAALLADALFDAGDASGAAAQAQRASELPGQPATVRAGLAWTRVRALAQLAGVGLGARSSAAGARDAHEDSAAAGCSAGIPADDHGARAAGSSAGPAAAAATALSAARNFWRDFPDHPAAAEEPALEAALVAVAGHPLPAPTPHDRMVRANHLLSAGQPKQAAAESLLGRNGLAGEARTEASLFYARALAADGRRGEAGPALEEAVRSAQPKIAAQAMLLLARDRSRRGDTAGALALLDQLAARFPRSGEADEGAYLAARLQLDDGDAEDGRARLLRISAERTANGAEARWTLAWLAYRANQPDAAARFAACAALASDAEGRARAVYWQARAGAPALAAPLYARALELDPLGWYGLLAREQNTRGAAPSADADDREAAPESNASVATDAGSAARGASRASPVALGSEAAGRGPQAAGLGSQTVGPAQDSTLAQSAPQLDGLARHLLQIGFSSEAAAQLDRDAQEHRGDAAKMLPILWGYQRAGRYDRSVPLAQNLLAGRPAPLEYRAPDRAQRGPDDPVLRGLLEAAYPFAFPEAVASGAARTELDPELILAVARRESVFKADARSAAGAVGLLQLLPITARRAAAVLGRPAPTDRDLQDPAVAIDLGAWYLSELLGRFRDPAIAVAAYNAGPRAVAPWVKAGQGEPLDVWVEEIPFKETRKYVKIVVGAWSAYRLLAGARAPKLSEQVPESLPGAAF